NPPSTTIYTPPRRRHNLRYEPKLNPLLPQQKVDTSAVDLWVPAATIGLNVSQIALSNWTQGGENSLTWTIIGTNGLKYLGPEWNFRTNFKAAYGRTKLGGSTYRTNDNELFLDLVVSKKVSLALDPYFSNTIRTAITTGYNYKVEPAERIADFFDPGYITQAIGFTYDKLAGFKTRFGFAVKETFTNRYREYSDDPDTPELEAFKIETGLESATNLDIEFLEDMFLKTSLRLFSSFEHLDVWDVRWDNSLIARVNKFINVNLSVLVIYEKKQSFRTQVKESLQLGLTYTIL
ncbi:MAG: DUF3078 domain-containing protein, partial [Ignavibacteriaceae bacterium]